MRTRSLLILPVAVLVGACSSNNGASNAGNTPRTVTIGSATGPAGGQVTVPITLTKVPPKVAVIVPLVFDFDASTLTFQSCAARVTGKSVEALSPSPGRVSVAVLGGMSVIPDGPLVDCTFGIKAGATHGTLPLRFVRAGMADLELHDIAGTGADGSVTVE